MENITAVAAMEAITQANQKISPLLRLPAELRNKIYAYVSDTVRLARSQDRPYRVVQAYHSGSVLNRICTQTRSEAASSIVSPRILYVDGSIMSSEFKVNTIQKLKLKNTTLIRTIELPLRIAEEVQFLSENTYEHFFFHPVWAKHFGRFLALFAGLRNVVIMDDEADMEEIVRKDQISVKKRNRMLLALRTLFCDGKDNLEMVMRD